MDAFAKQADPALNLRFHWLSGYADVDRADAARRAKDYPKAQDAITRALAKGEYWYFYEGRGELRYDREDNEGALADFDRALALRPGEPNVLFRRAAVLARLKRWEEAVAPLLAGLRVDATSERGRIAYDAVLKGLDSQGWEYSKAGRKDDALRLYELAMDLAPSDQRLLNRRASVILGKDPDVPSLEAAVARSPDDFRTLLSLDYALSKTKEWSRIEAMWTGYIARHPDDARPYLERCATYRWMGKPEAAIADAVKACELGSSTGCHRERILRDKRP